MLDDLVNQFLTVAVVCANSLLLLRKVTLIFITKACNFKCMNKEEGTIVFYNLMYGSAAEVEKNEKFISVQCMFSVSVIIFSFYVHITTLKIIIIIIIFYYYNII